MIVYGDAPQISFGVEKLGQLEGLPEIIICNLDTPQGRERWRGERPRSPQGYAATEENGTLTLAGGACGCMYALLDVQAALRMGAPLPSGVREPAVEWRGIKLNAPLDARTPSYSDASDSAWSSIPDMWDEAYWHELLDTLACQKMNLVSVWSLNPFSSMVRVLGFERAALDDVMRTPRPVSGAALSGYGMITERLRQELVTIRRITMDEKIAFWRRVMRYGADRGISFVVMTWNLFTYGAREAGYGITDSTDNPVTKAYFRAAVKSLVETYPLLAGVGVTAGERMSYGRKPDTDVLGDVRWLWETYGRGICDALPEGRENFRFIFRQHMSGAREIQQVFGGLTVPLVLSFKHSQAHMYSSPDPVFGKDFYAGLPEGQKTFLTVRNDDLYMYRYGCADFVRAYVGHMPLDKVEGMMLGPDGYTWGRDALEREGPRYAVPHRRDFELTLWGWLTYDPTVSDELLCAALRRLPGVTPDGARGLFQAGRACGWIIPRINMAHWHDFDFQHYPEANCGLDWRNCVGSVGRGVLFHDVHDYIQTPAQKGSGRLSVAEACALEHEGKPYPEKSVTPMMTANALEEDARSTMEALEELPPLEGEAAALAEDFRGLALLGCFFAAKLRAAVETLRVLNEDDDANPREAVEQGELAYEHWKRYAEHTDAYYMPQRLTRMCGQLVDVKKLCADARADADRVRMMMEPYF